MSRPSPVDPETDNPRSRTAPDENPGPSSLTSNQAPGPGPRPDRDPEGHPLVGVGEHVADEGVQRVTEVPGLRGHQEWARRDVEGERTVLVLGQDGPERRTLVSHGTQVGAGGDVLPKRAARLPNHLIDHPLEPVHVRAQAVGGVRDRK